MSPKGGEFSRQSAQQTIQLHPAAEWFLAPQAGIDPLRFTSLRFDDEVPRDLVAYGFPQPRRQRDRLVDGAEQNGFVCSNLSAISNTWISMMPRRAR